MRIILLLLGVFWLQAVLGQSGEIHLQKQILLARDQVMPALVHVEPVIQIFSRGEKQHTLVTGSGVIFSQQGYVLTNHHVAANAGDADMRQIECAVFSFRRASRGELVTE